VSRSIDGLEKRGWIERKKDPVDSRKKIVMLTPQAMDVAERCSSIAETVLNDAEKHIDKNEVSVNKQHLSFVIENLRELNK
jgi:DNA-binding MarR family transcriptional regulator